jgi:hypothetical protein
MDILTFVGSLTEPVRLALVGSGLIIGALLLSKVLLFGHSALKPLPKPTFPQGKYIITYPNTLLSGLQPICEL